MDQEALLDAEARQASPALSGREGAMKQRVNFMIWILFALRSGQAEDLDPCTYEDTPVDAEAVVSADYEASCDR